MPSESLKIILRIAKTNKRSNNIFFKIFISHILSENRQKITFFDYFFIFIILNKFILQIKKRGR